MNNVQMVDEIFTRWTIQAPRCQRDRAWVERNVDEILDKPN
ncbi:MAG: hypothetical protein AVDCRST_MAG93-7348 [uncultured Chloroflexia bacterium]|uniref:Uncharacterized protein n=1 Tax=uncultured Chloroflexia bacterium TaxID=1672391 RepID=A0A6J4MC86_9CHLR|nr:MAG: hypothetical protein AVDCRST_MAG93-7348 [uncultured Chloroflexia bacterium]